MKNISKIISIAFLSFSILLLCYVFYRSQIFHSGTKFDYYLTYYTIAFLLIIFSFSSFFIPEKIKINITLVLVSILIGIYLVEGYLTVKNPYYKFIFDTKYADKNFDKRTLLEIYQDLKKEDPNVVISLHGMSLSDDNSIYFSLSGLSNRKTIFCNENGYYSIYNSDRYGFNNPDKEWDKEEIEFFLVGDSFAHGACVNEPDTISGNLRTLIDNKGGILNLGQDDNGTLIEYATLREYLPVKRVKRVLWLYYANDLTNLSNELNNKILVNYLNDKNFTQNIISRKQEIEKLLLKKIEQTRIAKLHSIKFSFVKLFLTRQIIFDKIKIYFSTFTTTSREEKSLLQLKEFEKILKLSNKLTMENNSKLYFILLPSYGRYTIKKNGVDYQEYGYKKITEIVESLDIPVIDIHKELFKKQKDPLSLFPFKKSGHYNEKGYQLVAKTIFNNIEELEK